MTEHNINNSNISYSFQVFSLCALSMSRHLLYLAILMTLKYNDVKTKQCENEQRCTCRFTEDIGTAVGCHNAKLNVSEACSLCQKIRNIYELDLSENDLSDIPDFCFKSCKILVELNLSRNNLKKCSANTFAGLSNLKILNLNNNILIEDGNFSGPETFKSVRNLEELHLQNNIYLNHDNKTLYYLSNIPHDVFPSLQYLYVDGLPNAYFSSNFRKYERLHEIDFSRDSAFCNIIGLTNRSFENVPNIKTLNLSNCNITSIEAGTFSPLKELKYLNLSRNMALGLTTLRNVSYGLQFTKIDILDYSKVYKTFGLSTELRRCDMWFLRNTTLREFYLNSNRISLVEANALYLLPSSLKIFWAEDNLLSYGPFALQIGCMQKLERLELSKQQYVHSVTSYNNELHVHEKMKIPTSSCEIPKTCFNQSICPYLEDEHFLKPFPTFPASLVTLTLRHLNLRYQQSVLKVPLTIKNNIESIDLSDNIMFNWSGSFIYLNKLKYLDLSDNFCTDVTADFFANAPFLESLNASNNKIGHRLAADIAGSIFKPLRNIRKLNLSNNWIEHLPKNIFIHLSTLQILDVSFNRISNVSFIPESMKKLTGVYLQQNKIQTLPFKLLHQLESNYRSTGENVSIDLSNNEIRMSCNNIAFLSWMIDHTQYFINIHSYTFIQDDGQTKSYKDMALSLRALQKGCQTYALVIIAAAVFITLFFAVVFGGVCYRFRWRLRFFYYMTKARYLGYQQVHNKEFQKVYQYDAFISYSDEDYSFVKDEMIPRLEGEWGLSLCIHQRDFLPGHYITENILQAITESKKTVILLSPSFLKSKWCIYEFNMARMESIYSREDENVVFAIMFEAIDMTYISLEMRRCLESESFLKFPTKESEIPYFWQMLKQALGGTKI